MRTTLRISICLNCALLGCLAFLVLHGQQARHQAETPAETDTLPLDAETVMPAPGVSPTAEVEPFHWSQIQSADYDTYIANLRGIGCPEQTIHDIVAADVDSLYTSRRQPLEQELAASNSAGRLAVETKLLALRNEESDAVSALLLAPPAAANTTPALTAEAQPSRSVSQDLRASVSTPQEFQSFGPAARELNWSASDVAAGSTPSRSVRQEPPAPISLPLVFHEVDPSVLTLNPQQAQVVNDLRQGFIEAVGGPNQDPNDPAYSQRWQASQPQADLDLWSMLGINAFQSYQIAAWAKAHDQTPSGP